MKKLIVFLFLVMFIGIVSAACCERLENNGPWCVNAPEDQCDDSYRSVPSSCESTPYCSAGCCYDSVEGECFPNTPQQVCKAEQGGIWAESPDCEIPQCQDGCCLIGDQAAFVSLVRCKRLGSVYGMDINFRTDVSNEVQCIAMANSADKGACVYDKDYDRTCEMLTQGQCSKKAESSDSVEFHKGFLCTAEDLGTSCVRTRETTCVNGRDEVFFVDSCGNIANVYDASKVNNDLYWTYLDEYSNEITACSDSDDGQGNANNPECGKCNYYLGSTCKAYKRGESASPEIGDNICKDLGCEYNGEEYKHGETWCAAVPGISKIAVKNESGEFKIISEGVYDKNLRLDRNGLDLPGGRYYRMVCYNGEVTVEPCADYRQEYCAESEVNEFRVGVCKKNMWEDCTLQREQEDCENVNDRDCIWLEEDDEIDEEDNVTIACVPRFPPGLQFWANESSEESEGVCQRASATKVVVFKQQIEDVLSGGEWECESGCDACENHGDYTGCQGLIWQAEMKLKCLMMGDCGNLTTNYQGYLPANYEDD